MQSLQFLQNAQNINTFLILFFFFWVLTVIGSYLNVIVARGLKDSFKGRSMCDHCQKELKARYMVPVFSALYLIFFNKAQTKCCSKSFSKKYLVTEIFAGLVGLLLGIVFIDQGLGALLILSPFVVIFLLLALQDFWDYEIDIFLAILMIIFFIIGFGLFQMSFQGVFPVEEIGQILRAGWIFGVGIVLVIILSKGRGIGAGDIFLLFFIGATLGLAIGLVAIQITIYLAAIAGIIYSVLKRKFKGLIIPLAPFLCLGWLVALVFLADFQNLIDSILLAWTF
jgi:leader peptidase (prepilin peptidase)/N-methyltransferase